MDRAVGCKARMQVLPGPQSGGEFKCRVVGKHLKNEGGGASVSQDGGAVSLKMALVVFKKQVKVKDWQESRRVVSFRSVSFEGAFHR